MRCAVELSDVHNIVLVLEHGSFVVVDVEVVWRRENGHNTRETGRSRLTVHSVSGILRFVRSDYGQEVVLLKESAGCRV